MKCIVKGIMQALTITLLMGCACSPGSPCSHDHRYAHPYTSHEQYWSNGIYRNYILSLPPNPKSDWPDKGKDFECYANGILLQHCSEY